MNRGHHAPLQEDRLLDLSQAFQQGKVLHVACAHLQDIGIFGHQLDIVTVHHFSHYLQSRSLPGLGKKLQTLFFQPLKTVWRSARLECAAPKDPGAALLYYVGDFQYLLARFDAARAGHDLQLFAADRDAVHVYLAVFFS